MIQNNNSAVQHKRQTDFEIGWDIYVRGGYIDWCANAAQRAGYVAAYRVAEMSG